MSRSLLSSLCALLCLVAVTRSLPLQEDEATSQGPRIVGGYVTDVSQTPYQISLRYKGTTTPTNPFRHRCGGSIISSTMVVTAAHCIIGTVASQFKVVAGTNLLSGTDGIIVSVSKIIMHEEYFSGAAYNNDIALLIVDPPLPINNFTIKAIELASEPPLAGAVSKISGWGTTSSGGVASNVLLAVDVPIVSNEDCNKDYEDFGDDTYQITPAMLCAGVRGVGGKDACQGDWGNACALAKYPGVYASVANLRTWLDSKIAEEANH
ncbi:trypsin zeta [Drosophila miranda]|uniref:trypsin zeta n=1 Tax=Drosophila miranda TaxID=7229 RepID=UPI00143F3BD2|nr:trypsin zeta [Drosophila miranda]